MMRNVPAGEIDDDLHHAHIQAESGAKESQQSGISQAISLPCGQNFLQLESPPPLYVGSHQLEEPLGDLQLELASAFRVWLTGKPYPNLGLEIPKPLHLEAQRGWRKGPAYQPI